jgi:hypothetical protein
MRIYYMPLWTKRESFEAAALLELKVDYESIQNYISRFGGSVRYILTDDEVFRGRGLHHQEAAINSVKSIADVDKYLHLKVGDEDIVQRVFYFFPNVNFPSEYEMILGSLYIAVDVADNLKTADERERLKLFRWLQSHGQSRSTAGWLFERYCHEILFSGVNAVAKSLTAGVDHLRLQMTQGYHRIVEQESIEEVF